MNEERSFVHPYIPNSVPEVKARMMQEIGITDINELYESIPEHLKFKRKMNLPEPLHSEYDLRRHVEQVLSKNRTCGEYLNFLGGGCWQHYVPAICDEINQRSEFLTGYAGEPYEDHGRFQALFEYESMMGELLNMDVVNVPTYDWGQAASTSIMMAGRITGRKKVLITDSIDPDRLLIIRNYCRGVMDIEQIKSDPVTGLINIDELKAKLSSNTACVYFENPSYLGIIEINGNIISDLAHKAGALSLTGADPISLGILTPPADYGADIVSGDIQPLGIHMQYGGGHAGFIATHDEERYIMEYPSRLFGVTYTDVENEWGFGDVTYDRTSFGSREQGKEFIGTATALWGITAAVYLALLGPEGMRQLGQTIMQKSQYAMKKISDIDNVSIKYNKSPHFKEFVIDLNETGKTIKNVNKALLKKGIFGGKDISQEYSHMGECALFCITEIHTKEDIDTLVEALKDSII